MLNLNTEIMAKEENISKTVTTFSTKTVDMETSEGKMKSYTLTYKNQNGSKSDLTTMP